jgi:hypothetical protein
VSYLQISLQCGGPGAEGAPGPHYPRRAKNLEEKEREIMTRQKAGTLPMATYVSGYCLGPSMMLAPRPFLALRHCQQRPWACPHAPSASTGDVRASASRPPRSGAWARSRTPSASARWLGLATSPRRPLAAPQTPSASTADPSSPQVRKALQWPAARLLDVACSSPTSAVRLRRLRRLQLSIASWQFATYKTRDPVLTTRPPSALITMAFKIISSRRTKETYPR